VTYPDWNTQNSDARFKVGRQIAQPTHHFAPDPMKFDPRELMPGETKTRCEKIRRSDALFQHQRRVKRKSGGRCEPADPNQAVELDQGSRQAPGECHRVDPW